MDFIIAGLRGLGDAAGSRFTLRFETGAMYRISLPPISCSVLVTKCCSALTAILPKDVTMQACTYITCIPYTSYLPWYQRRFVVKHRRHVQHLFFTYFFFASRLYELPINLCMCIFSFKRFSDQDLLSLQL